VFAKWLRSLIFAAQGATLAAQLTGFAVLVVAGLAPMIATAGEMRVGAQVHDLTPQEVSQGLAEGRYLVVDVREPNEVAAEAYPDAVVVPLSSFDPKQIPDPKGKEVVFACRSGKRSVTASLAAQAAGLAYDKHLAGGILGWKAAGLPTKHGN
jgi:rhodanese-related sulfurtransferase